MMMLMIITGGSSWTSQRDIERKRYKKHATQGMPVSGTKKEMCEGLIYSQSSESTSGMKVTGYSGVQLRNCTALDWPSFCQFLSSSSQIVVVVPLFLPEFLLHSSWGNDLLFLMMLLLLSRQVMISLKDTTVGDQRTDESFAQTSTNDKIMCDQSPGQT